MRETTLLLGLIGTNASNFPYYTPMGEKNENYSQTNIAEDFMPEGWQWVYDETEPTNRKLYQVLSENSYEDLIKH